MLLACQRLVQEKSVMCQEITLYGVIDESEVHLLEIEINNFNIHKYET